MRVATDLSVAATPGTLRYEDKHFLGHAGWKGIVIVAGNGAAVDRTEPSGSDRSQELVP
jgi:hypothetical protein